MSPPESSELLVRGAALYLPVVLVIALALHARPDRRGWAAVLLATVWNLVGLLVVNVVAVRMGWWAFDADVAVVAGVPADLWVGWVLLWGAVPALAPGRAAPVIPLALVVADLVLMPLGEPVVVLGRSWLVGETVAVALCLLPGIALARWTAANRRLEVRAAMQLAAFTGALFYVLPSLIFTQAGDGWEVLLARPRWHFVVAGLLVSPFAALAVQGVCEFVRHGGTPLPLDPPPGLVQTGPYAYVANPMQAGATALLAAWGALLSSAAVIAAAAMAAVFSAGLAAWSEDQDLARRFGDDWTAYRVRVRTWVPTWRPRRSGRARIYVASTCEPCDEVGGFLRRLDTTGLDVVAAEACPRPLVRITYEDHVGTATGIAAIGRAVEHVHVGWATASWIARLPGIEQLLQLIADAAGGGPRPLPESDPSIGARPVIPSSTGGSSWPAS